MTPRLAPQVPMSVRARDVRARGASVPVACGLAALSILGCGDVEKAAPTPRGLELTVAPLTLAGIGVACYDVRVTSGAGLVWSKGDPSYNLLGQDQTIAAGDPTTNPPDPQDADDDTLCSDDFGNRGGGSIVYVGPCDAMSDANTTTPEVENAVTLWVDGLYDAVRTADIGDWQDPCPNGCTLEFDCVENRDTQVEFDLTILRSARQGFVDVAVDFEDVFCSAKLDCVPELLFRPDGGPRDLTAVLGFACSSGALETCLYANSVTLDCGGDNVWSIDPSLGPGNIAESCPLLFAAATYSGDEAYTTFQKSYWNIGLGLDETLFSQYPNCTLRWTTTASEAPLVGNATPAGTTYPFLVWERKIIDGGQLDCAAHPLNEVLDGETEASVATEYTEVDVPETFAHTNCQPEEASCACPEGYDANVDGTVCTRTQMVAVTPPTATLGVCAGNSDSTYSMFGANFAASWSPAASFEITESGSNPCASSPNPDVCVNEPEDAGWTDYLTHVGVWTCPAGTSTPIGEWIGFSKCIELDAAGDYLIGIAGDNRVRLRIDANDVYTSVSSLNFRAWNVSRVSLTAGTHIIELFGLNDGAVAAFGAEIYGPFPPGTVTTPTQMAAALNPNEEGFADHLVFSTRDLRDAEAQFDSSLNGDTGYTCPDGYALSLCSLPATCVDIDEVACQE